MRGKLIMSVSALAVGIPLMWYLSETSPTYEQSQSSIGASNEASPDRIQATRHDLPQADGRLVPHQRVASAEMVAVEGNGRVQTDTSEVVPAETEARIQALAPGSDAAPQLSLADDSVVGQPFPVSESILVECEKSPSSACEPNRAMLAEMAEQPREEPWATSAEQAIEALVELEPGTDKPRAVTHTIRALECRKTICFVETASVMEGFSSEFFYFQRTNRLRAGYAIDGSETAEDGTKVYVTLLPIVRVPLSTRELTEGVRRH